jgi:hypothetical protein
MKNLPVPSSRTPPSPSALTVSNQAAERRYREAERHAREASESGDILELRDRLRALRRAREERAVWNLRGLRDRLQQDLAAVQRVLDLMGG